MPPSFYLHIKSSRWCNTIFTAYKIRYCAMEHANRQITQLKYWNHILRFFFISLLFGISKKNVHYIDVTIALSTGYHAMATCYYMYVAGGARNGNWFFPYKCSYLILSYFPCVVFLSLFTRHYRGYIQYWFARRSMQCDAYIICLQLDKYKIVIQLWSTSRYLIRAI